MNMDVAFKNAKVFNVQDRIDVVKGEKFSLITDLPDTVRWFTNNDPVLSVIATGPIAVLTADILGASTLLILDENDEKLKKLTINVVASIEEPASSLNTSAGSPVAKN